jgi:hypothetical protein
MVGDEAARELEDAFDRIRHCADQLSDVQLWWRSAPELNSIANLMLHIQGNLRQWIIAGLGGAADQRNRPAEFMHRGPLPRQTLLGDLQAVVVEAANVLRRVDAALLAAERRIQGFQTTGLGAVFHAIPHFRGHTQEIVNITRQQLGDRYRFAWIPATVEQGAPPHSLPAR